MKQLRFLLLLIAVFTVNVLAQNNPTFDRSYSNHRYAITHIEENVDGTFYLYGSDEHNSYIIIKTDSEGNSLWEKEYLCSSYNYQGLRFCDKTIIKHENNNLVVLTKKPVEDPNRNKILRVISKTGEVFSEKEYLNTDSVKAKQIAKIGDGYCLSFKVNVPFSPEPYWNILLIKTDNEFNEIWRKKIDGGRSFYNEPSVIQMNDSLFAYSTRNSVFISDNNGNIVDTIKSASTLNLQTLNDSILLCGSTKKLSAFNFSGDSLWESPGGMVEVIDERIFTRRLDYQTGIFPLMELNSSGDLINQNQFRSNIHSIKKTQDGKLVIGGSVPELDYTTFARLENNLEFEGVDLVMNYRTGWSLTYSWDSTVVFYAFNQNKIEWYNTDGIDFIDIEFSTDNGNNWNEIISYFPANTSIFSWEVPGDITENGLLRIKESSNGSYDDIKKIKIRIRQDYDFISINDIKMWIGSNGDGSHSPLTDGSGLFWPAESEKTLIYEDGLVWGLKVIGEIRVNGNTHRYGIRPGIIKEDGTAGDPLDPEYKIYKVRKDWQLLPPSVERDRFKYDYINWPSQNGAPFIDNDYDGIYTPFVDEPDWHGDEMLFYVANDLDSATTFNTYGSPPIGLEQQCLTYGYDREDFLKDVVFKKYRIINKSENDWTDMYLSYWSDDDMGDAGDDYVGCDTLLNLGYTYSGDEYDDTYGIPPAVGHMFLQGPIKESPGDSAVFKGDVLLDYVNLPISRFNIYYNANGVYTLPSYNYEGALEFYNQMQGFTWKGDPFIDPNTGDTTKFVVSGDPVSGTGWYMGDGWPGGPLPRNFQNMITSGTFTLAAGDTQEVVLAILAAQGTDRLNSVTELKNTARKVREFYYGQFITDVEEDNNNQPLAFKLEQNYPNPFNPATKIKYSIPAIRTNSNSSVRLIVYDVLGKEVARLVDEKKSPGNYEVIFNASVLSSGVYFYRLQSGSFIQTKKMVLLK